MGSLALVLLSLNDDMDREVLTNTPNNWSEGLLQLPVNSIIEHVEEDDRLISDTDITVSLELDQQFLDPVESVFVICDLSNEKSSLDLLKIFILLLDVSLTKLIDVLLVHCLIEWELTDVDDDFAQGG